MSYQNHRTLPLPVCAAVIRDADRFLITQRPANKPHPGFWEFPGGKIEPGESPHLSLRRELQEELDIEIQVGPVLETAYFRYDWGSVLIIAYDCHWLSGTLKHLEVADHRWVTIEQLSQVQILPADQPIINRLASLPGQPSENL